MPLLILFLPRERDFLGSQIVEIEVAVAVQRAKNTTATMPRAACWSGVDPLRSGSRGETNGQTDN